MRKATFPVGREAWLTLGLVLVLIVTAAAGLQFTRATVLTLAVAPNGGTEPELLRAYAAELARRKTGVQLRILDFPGVRESAEALRTGKADLAVVRPDVAMPGNGLTLAILRELAAFAAAPAQSGIGSIPDLAGKRLGCWRAGTRTGCSCAI